MKVHRSLPPNHLATPEKYFLNTNCDIGTDPVFAIYFDSLTKEQKNIFVEQRWKFDRMAPDDAALAKRFNVSETVRVFWSNGTDIVLLKHVGPQLDFYATLLANPTPDIESRSRELVDMLDAHEDFVKPAVPSPTNPFADPTLLATAVPRVDLPAAPLIGAGVPPAGPPAPKAVVPKFKRTS